MLESDAKPKSLGQKIWDFIENPLGQTGGGLVLLAIGAFLSSKAVMVLAFIVLVVAAYRAKLFDHNKLHHRILSWVLVPLALVVLLIAVWAGAAKLKTMDAGNAQAQPTTPPAGTSGTNAQQQTANGAAAASKPAHSNRRSRATKTASSAKSAGGSFSGVNCGRVDKLPAGWKGTSNCQDMEISDDNRFSGFNSVVENAGKMEHMQARGNIVVPPPHGGATIIDNKAGGEMKDITLDKNEVKPALVIPASPQPTMSQECAPGASCAMSNGQQGGITAGTLNIQAIPLPKRADIQFKKLWFRSTPQESGAPHWEEGEPILVGVRALNEGADAKKICGVFRIAISSTATEQQEQQDQERLWNTVTTQLSEMHDCPNSLFAGRDAVIVVQYPLPIFHESALTEQDIQDIKKSTKRLVLAGIYKYTDDLGTRETHICQCYSGEGGHYWIDCYGHNEIIP